MKSYRYYEDEMEVLGGRLDAARRALDRATTPWAKNQWTQTLERLLFQWRQLPLLHDGDAQVTLIPRYDIDYDFYENTQEAVRYGITDRFYDSIFNQEANLDASWNAHREKRLAKAQ